MAKHVGVTVGHVRRDTGVYIGRGRGSKLGNPFTVERYGRADAIARYRLHLWSDPRMLRELPGLRGKTVVCWCRSVGEAGPACHGDVINRALEALSDEQIQARIEELERQ